MIIESGALKSPAGIGQLFISPFISVSVLLHMFWGSVVRLYTLYFLDESTLLTPTKYPSLSLVTIFALKSILSDVSAIPALFSWCLVWYIFLHL